ncbi:metal transporter uex isoform X2 [Lycorma delicatula]|uniref:metal transporter uex isoform X2 n=1 Tax=Lycorma delicatula TaxID=130591 RepID=UPI003F5138C5
MARDVVSVSIYITYFLTILYVSKAKVLSELVPIVKSISVINETSVTNQSSEMFSKIIVEMRGYNFYSGMKVRATTNPEYGECSESISDSDSEHDFSELWSNSTLSLMALYIKLKPGINNQNFYVCVRSVERTTTTGDQSTFISTFPSEVIKWVHQGKNVVFRTASEYVFKSLIEGVNPSEQIGTRRRVEREGETWNTKVHQNVTQYEGADVAYNTEPHKDGINKTPLPNLVIYGYRLEDSDKEARFIQGTPQLRVGSSGVLRLFGRGWTGNTYFTLTSKKGEKGQHCEVPIDDKFKLDPDSIKENTALLQITMPALGKPDTNYFLCFKEEPESEFSENPPGGNFWRYVGSEDYLQIGSYEKVLPLWLSVVIVLLCLGFSSLFSGLNLGLMALNNTELKIISNTGTDLERRYAAKIIPVRIHGNYLLCSILLGNVMVNSTFTILLDDLTSGLVAVVTSTLAIVILGEITPQAVCSRHGLAIGARTIYVTKIVMVLTFPLAYPISKILDWVLGEEIGAVYTRERLKELIKLTTEYSELEKDEVNIISGALELRKKIVADVMTKLEDVYMLSYDAVLDFETVSEIMKSGYSRVPVYVGDRHNVVTVLLIKDLALVDPDDNTPLKTLCQFYQNPFNYVFENTTLDGLLKKFKKGNKGHMAFVHRVNNEGEGDPFYETVGIITLEDVIEELIQAEIMDETDVWTDNRTKHRRSARNIKQDFTAFAERSEVQRIHISPQLTLATFQYLSTSVDPFKPEVISESVLSRLLKQDIIHHIKVKKDKSKNDPDTIIYQQGKPVDYFVLILEGRVEVTVGRENLVFESGPFTYFGLQALMQTVGVAESPTGIASASQQLGSLQSVNLDAMLRHSFVPDYTVRAITEVFYLSVKRSLFLAAKRATLMERSKKEEVQSGDVFDAEVEKLSREDMDAETKIVDSTNKPESQVVNNKSGTASSKPNVTFNEKVLKKSSKIPLKSNEQESVGFNVFSYNVSCVDQNRPTTSCFNATSNTDESLSVEIFEDLLS